MKNKIVSRIKTSAGELQLSEDALCKHTIFIGSTGSNTLFKIRKWAKECGREEGVIDYCTDSQFYFDPLGGLDSFRKIPEYVERIYNIFPFQSSEVYWE